MAQNQVELFAYRATDYESAKEAEESGVLTSLGVFANHDLTIEAATFAAVQMAWCLGYGIREIGIAIKKQDGTFDDDVHMNH